MNKTDKLILKNKLRKYWLYYKDTSITPNQYAHQQKIFELFDKIHTEKKLNKEDELFLESIKEDLKNF